jgi:HEAT repeat protein
MLTVKNRAILTSMLACSILAIAAVGLQAAEDNASAAKAREAKCITLLKSNAPVGDKAAACKQLALCGTKDAVPALMPLLADEHLAAWARIALEVIPDSAVDDAVRESIGNLKGRCLIGVIHSIGRRGDAKAVALIAAKLKDPDAAVAVASALALGDIGNASAAAALEDALANTPPAVRSAAAEGCIVCAEKCLAAGKADEALKIYDLVRKADLPSQRIREAIRGAILARKAAGVPLLVELLRSQDKQMFNLGLTVARELPGKEAADALAAEFAKAAPERQALLVLAIADRGDVTGLPALLQVAKSGPDSVRIALVKLLRQSGNASCVPLLLELAVDQNPELAAAAMESLSGMSGKEVDAEIVARLSKAEGKVRLLLLQLVGDRMLTKAIPEVIKAVSDPDLQVRLQALATLGYAVEFKDLSVLIGRVAVATENGEEAKAAGIALGTACQRMPDTEACAAQLAAAMGAAKIPARIHLLETLAALGGKKALETVAAAATDSNDEIQNAATRLLGKWMTLDAAPVLATLAQSPSCVKYQVRLVRAYIRLMRQFPMPNEDRIKMCRTAMAIAKGDDEKKLLLNVLSRYPSPEGLALAAELVKTPSLKVDAYKSIVTIVQKIDANSPQVQSVLAEAGLRQAKVEILKAEYGGKESMKDVTGLVRSCAHGFALIPLMKSSYNEAFGGDPAPGVMKELRIEYRLNDKAGKATFAENASIFLPTP